MGGNPTLEATGTAAQVPEEGGAGEEAVGEWEPSASPGLALPCGVQAQRSLTASPAYVRSRQRFLPTALDQVRLGAFHVLSLPLFLTDLTLPLVMP